MSPLTPYLHTRLGRRAQGPSVAALQRVLGLPADGRFTTATTYRVMALQRAHHLTADGVATDATWRALGAGTAVPGSPSRMGQLFLST